MVDGKISAAAFAGRRVFVIGIQAAELQATRTPERRAALLAAFEKINPATVPASSFLLGIEGAGLGQAEWNDGSGIFEKMLNRLQALDRNNATGSLHNQLRDISIAETAFKKGATVVSDDINLRKVMSEFGGRAIDCSEFGLEVA